MLEGVVAGFYPTKIVQQGTCLPHYIAAKLRDWI